MSSNIISGWLLFSCLLLLMLFYLRKRLSTLPLGRAYHWAQTHIFLGLFSFFYLAIAHINHWLPSGIFEVSLYILFLTAIISGLLLIAFNRLLPKILRLKYATNRAPLGLLWAEKSTLARKLEEIIQTAVQNGLNKNTLFELHRIQGLLSKQFASAAQQLFFIKKENQDIKASIGKLAKNCDESLINELTALVDKLIITQEQIKEQLILKLLLSAHIFTAVTCCIWVFIHIYLVYAFSGS
mgnify:CR=1 FL=1